MGANPKPTWSKDWLAQPEQQSKAIANGLRPVEVEPTASATLFAAAESFGILLQPDYGTLVEAPSRTEASSLVQWFSTAQR